MSVTLDSPRARKRRERAGVVPRAIPSLEPLATLTEAEAIETVKRGLPAPLARELSERLGVSLEAMAGPLQLTVRTLHRRMQDGTLAQPESERLFAVVKAFFRAVEVLGSEEKATHWLTSRPPVLLGRSPLECMDTWLGIQKVDGLLWRIEDGVFS